MYVFCEVVNRSVRLLEAQWTNSRVSLCQPWKFVWACDVAYRMASSITKSDPHMRLIVFPISWSTSPLPNGVSLEGSLRGKNGLGLLPIITLVHWKEEAQR